jgi:mRNA interferase RelE/StbE
MKYEVLFKPKFLRALKRIDKVQQIRILSKIYKLSEDPRPPASKRLKGSVYYRLRVGDYRIIYDVADANLTVLILDVGHRQGVYKG